MAAQKRKDGQISEGVYIAMQYDADSVELVRLFIGTPETGPMLQFDDRPFDTARGCYSINGWTPIYSRGNFGRNYSHGGNWSGHSRNLTTSRLIGEPPAGDSVSEAVVSDGDVIPLPKCGIKGDISATSIDCSGSWSVFFETAKEALDDMLTGDEIKTAKLPEQSKKLLSAPAAAQARQRVAEVIKAFDL
jgi:hypothetical protein